MIMDQYFTHGFISVTQNRIRISSNCSIHLKSIATVVPATPEQYYGMILSRLTKPNKAFVYRILQRNKKRDVWIWERDRLHHV